MRKKIDHPQFYQMFRVGDRVVFNPDYQRTKAYSKIYEGDVYIVTQTENSEGQYFIIVSSTVHSHKCSCFQERFILESPCDIFTNEDFLM